MVVSGSVSRSAEVRGGPGGSGGSPPGNAQQVRGPHHHGNAQQVRGLRVGAQLKKKGLKNVLETSINSRKYSAIENMKPRVKK